MKLYEGYVLASELWRECNVSVSLFRPEHGFDVEKLGIYNVVKIKSLPDKYKTIAQTKCTNLGTYYPMREFERMLGLSVDHLSSLMCQKLIEIKTKKIHRARLVKLTDDFIKHIKDKKEPFYVSKQKKNHDFADVIIDMYGIKIGFY